MFNTNSSQTYWNYSSQKKKKTNWIFDNKSSQSYFRPVGFLTLPTIKPSGTRGFSITGNTIFYSSFLNIQDYLKKSFAPC